MRLTFSRVTFRGAENEPLIGRQYSVSLPLIRATVSDQQELASLCH